MRGKRSGVCSCFLGDVSGVMKMEGGRGDERKRMWGDVH